MAIPYHCLALNNHILLLYLQKGMIHCISLWNINIQAQNCLPVVSLFKFHAHNRTKKLTMQEMFSKPLEKAIKELFDI